MKRLITLIIAIVIIFSLFGCAKIPEKPSQNTSSDTAQTTPAPDADKKDGSSLPYDIIWAAAEADEYDNDTAYDGILSITADEFREELISRYGSPFYRAKSTDNNSGDDEYLIEKGVVSFYAGDDGLCVALVITEDTHNLNDMRVIVLRSGAEAAFGVTKVGSLISDFGKSERGAVTTDSALYLGFESGQAMLFVESAKNYINGNADYEYELRAYILSGIKLNFCSDLRYSGTEGKRLTSRSLPVQLADTHYTMDSGAYVLYGDAFSDDNTAHPEIHNDFTKLSEAVSAYFECFGIERNGLVKKKDACRIKYGTGITKIADFMFHAGEDSAAICLTDHTGLK